MKFLSFCVILLGFLILGYFYFFGNVIQISDIGDLESLVEGQKVVVSGLVYREGTWGEDYRLFLSNGVEVICDCFGYSGLDVRVEGSVQDFHGKRVVVKKIDIK